MISGKLNLIKFAAADGRREAVVSIGIASRDGNVRCERLDSIQGSPANGRVLRIGQNCVLIAAGYGGVLRVGNIVSIAAADKRVTARRPDMVYLATANGCGLGVGENLVAAAARDSGRRRVVENSIAAAAANGRFSVTRTDEIRTAAPDRSLRRVGADLICKAT